ncbi:similar to transcription initiation factor TFIID subunit 7 [Plenodomus lingam JN3]|uniref:Similar to transcription initiation factor TFIID subunit 7 n=2 Tax=Leptosphaeria maculans TaxID=5022 RepID=E4ZVJ5_LEPMJ|nr:similar to transcription initiation factor TFIID subunit 7 [Plenodomus lingam JN3]CBX95621.1 similar to transcription initiation factor TFIID subunit 7 [Plenodomus lingam JN3]
MKLKLKNPTAAPAHASGEAPSADAATPVSAKPGGGLKLKLKPAASSTPVAPSTASAPAAPVAPTAPDAAEGAKPKRKYNKKPKFDESGAVIPPGKPGPKKRVRDDENDELDTPAAKRKPKPTAKSLAMANDSSDDEVMAEPAPRPQPPTQRVPSLKLSIKPKTGASGTPAQPGTKTAILKVKGAGKPPVRPYGVGYDSEAEEAEVDPAIESQFVLRMQPGPDCDLLRKSIEEKTIGKSVSAGGPGVYFRFFDREGRRALIQIQNRQYAATMVELPAVIESLKSWNKKDWVKTADICQMLLVLGRVNNEEEAKKYPRPSYVEPDSHRFPHGLTPPMQWARKLRFRPRKSYLDVERAEAQMNRLLAEDEKAISTRYELIDSGDESSDNSSSEEELDDEEMPDGNQVEDEGMDAAEIEQMLHAGFMEDDEVEVTGNGDDLEAMFGNSDNTLQVETPTTAHDVAMHAINPNGSITLETDTAASTPGAATSADDDDDDDDADSDDEVDEVDEAAAAEEQRQEQLRAEIAELEKAIAQSVEQRERHTNLMYKKRLQATIDKQKADLIIKQRQLNEEVEE